MTSTWIDLLFEPYRNTPTLYIVLEATAFVFGLLSVLLSRKEHIGVFPTGIVSTGIYCYLLIRFNLLGDSIINGYYLIMSIYGWWFWKQQTGSSETRPITSWDTSTIKNSLLIAIVSAVFVSSIYWFLEAWEGLVSAVDTLTTSVFFVAMWLMAKKKLQHWLWWIVGDLISIPLYAYKGLYLTSLQYLLFTAIAISAYRLWRKNWRNNTPTFAE